MTAATCGCSDHRFFWMQSDWPSLLRIFVEKLGESWSMRKTSWDDVASECLGFHDGDVRFTGDGEKIIGRAAAHQAGCSVMIREGDLMHFLPIDAQWANPTTNECPRLNRAAQSDYANVVPIVDLEFARELGRNFGEHFRLQFGEITEKARHAASRMMFGQAIGGQNKWKPRIAGQREPVLAARKPVHRRICVVRIKFV